MLSGVEAGVKDGSDRLTAFRGHAQKFQNKFRKSKGRFKVGLMPEFTFGIMPSEFPDRVQVACQQLVL